MSQKKYFVMLFYRSLSHENFMPYAGFSHDDNAIYIVSPFISKGSLFDLLQKEALLPSLKVKLAEDIIKGLGYLHENNIIHRDLKANNIMVCTNVASKNL